MYIHDTTKEQLTHRNLRLANPTVSIAVDGTNTIMSVWYYVNKTDRPSYNPYTHKVEADVPARTGDSYYQVWSTVPLTQLEIDTYIADALILKEAECDEYAEDLVTAATANPQVGVTADATAYQKRADYRRKDYADKQAGEIALTQAEKDQAKVDQKLSEYGVKVYADSDKAITNVNKLTTATEIYAFDVSAETWNVWTPPV